MKIPLVAGFVVATSILACPEPAPPPEKVCEPNRTLSCACPGGVEGVQTCRYDGTGWGDCDCGGGDDAGQQDAAADASTAADVQAADIAVADVGQDDTGAVDGGGADSGAQDAGPQLCEPHALACSDEMYLQLSMHDLVSAGAVANSEAAGVFTTVIDATAGGMLEAPNSPYVYVKFLAEGAAKVAISDDQALASQDWDLAAKRYIVRLNSGDSGPSCVLAARVAGGFDAIGAVPAGADFAYEDFYDDDCGYVVDSRFASTGMDAPDNVLATWWEYNSCVATTGQVFVLQLADDSHLKLEVVAYYESGQAECNSSGVVGTGSAMLTVRWAWL